MKRMQRRRCNSWKQFWAQSVKLDVLWECITKRPQSASRGWLNWGRHCWYFSQSSLSRWGNCMQPYSPKPSTLSQLPYWVRSCNGLWRAIEITSHTFMPLD